MASYYYIAVLSLAFLGKKLFNYLFFVCISKQLNVNCTPQQLPFSYIRELHQRNNKIGYFVSKCSEEKYLMQYVTFNLLCFFRWNLSFVL